jgi:hypothetical protein
VLQSPSETVTGKKRQRKSIDRKLADAWIQELVAF